VRSLPISLILVLPLVSATPASAQTESHLPARIQQSATFYRNQDGFMGVVAVQRKQHLLYESGYGYANVTAKTPFTPDTRFPVGSISKQFTAAAILLLQQDGKLKTSDSIERYYPKAPASWNRITLRNLLTQTSGLADFDFGEVYRNTHHRPREFIEDISNKPLGFQPGTKYEYSNTNYLLLGLVVEKASGHSLCHFLRDRVFHPLQLNQTDCAWNDHVPGSAQGYHPSDRGPVPFEDRDLNSITGAGSLYSTADDLIRWTEALHGGRVLSRVSLIEMTTPFLNGYAYGLDIDGEGAQLDISHNGTVEGFFSCLDYLPASHTTIVVLSNLVAEGNGSTPGTLALDTELVRLGMEANPILPSDGKQARSPRTLFAVMPGITGQMTKTIPRT
jgi:CubicO group peptidase (beta-lactamase class C family)